ncbi:HAD family hydrolase [Silvimonas sp. JCM 19000]
MNTAAKQVRLMIFDIDGVMTDGSLFYTDAGEEIKAFNALDGHGIRMLANTGVEIAIITGRQSKLVAHRAANLKITHVYQGSGDKGATFAELLDATGFKPEECGYMGDDVIDLPVMTRVAFAVSVPDAPEFVRRHAQLVTTARGGHGAVREACETIMAAQGTLEGVLASYLR